MQPRSVVSRSDSSRERDDAVDGAIRLLQILNASEFWRHVGDAEWLIPISLSMNVLYIKGCRRILDLLEGINVSDSSESLTLL